jgi:hypothetical protein
MIVIAACGGEGSTIGSTPAPAPTTTTPPSGGSSGGSSGGVSPGATVCGTTAPSCTSQSFPPAIVADVKAASAGFRGTVTKLGASTEPSLPPAETARAAVVRIDSLLGGMPADPFLSSFVGREVTIVSAAAPTVAVGETSYFFANEQIVGVGIVLGEVAHVAPASAPTIEADVPAIVKTLADRKLYDRLAKASVIATATVGTTRDLGAPGPVSEHSPDWAEGSATAGCVVRGGVASGASLAIRFAASVDIAWKDAPKLTAKQTSLFVLADDDVTKVPGPAFVVVDPLDVEPTSSLASIVTLLACPPPVL